jgi:hypothetical protein
MSTSYVVQSSQSTPPSPDCITEAIEVALVHARGLSAGASVAALEAAQRVWSVEKAKKGGAR